MVSAGGWLDRGHSLGVIILCMFTNCKLSQIKCIELEIYKAPRVGVTLTRPTLMGLMCVLLQPQPCRLAPRSGSYPHVPHPIPCFSGGRPYSLWGSAPMASPGGPILVASSSPSSWGWGTEVIPNTLPWSGLLLAAVSPPGLRVPIFPIQKLPGPQSPLAQQPHLALSSHKT